MPILTLLRHGISYTNEGREVHSEFQNILTNRGVKQAIESAESHREAHPDLHYDFVLSSPYQRAYQTSLLFLSTFDNQPVDIQCRENLKERSYGFDRFINMEQLIADHGQEAVDGWDLHLDTRPHPSGETQKQVYDRTVHTFNEEVMEELWEGKNVLVVAHYYVLKALLAHIDHGHPGPLPTYNPRNCTPYSYELQGQKDFKLVSAPCRMIGDEKIAKI